MVGERWFAPEDRRDHLRLAVTFKGSAARHCLVENGAKREHIGSGIYGFPLNLFRRHVLQSADDRASSCDRRVCGETRQTHQSRLLPQLGDTEVQYLGA
jgi:hypothetical protein